MIGKLLILAVSLVPALTQDLPALEKILSRSKSASQRLEALDEIAQLYSEGEVGVEVTRAVASALEDDALLVRARASELLGGRLDEDLAITALVRAAERFKRDQKSVFEQPKRLPKMPELGKDKKDEFLEKLDARKAAIEARLERTRNWRAYREALLAALSARSDDRCVEGLGGILEAQPVGKDADVIIDALLGYGTQPALEHVLDAVRAFERTLDARKKQRKKVAAQRPQKKPGYWKGTKEAWKAREARRIAGLVEKYDQATADLQEWGGVLCDRLRAMASQRGLDPAPPTLAPYRPWSRWARKELSTLPPSLND